jgi:PAS domain-containing protein
VFALQAVAAFLVVLALAAALVRHRLLRDWRLWLVPTALALFSAALLQGLVGPTRGFGRFVEIGWVSTLAALVCGIAAVLLVVVLNQVLEETHRAQESSRIREQWLRMLTGRLPAVVWTTNRKQTVTSHVGGGHRRMGIRPNEFIGRSLVEYFGGDDEASSATDAATHALKGESVAFEIRWRGAMYEGFVEPLYERASRIAGTIGFLLHTSEMQHGSPTDREADALLALASRRLSLAFWVTDLTGRVTFADGSGLAQIGVDCGDVVGVDARQMADDAGTHDAGIEAHRRALEGESQSYRVEMDTGSADCHLEPLRDGEGGIVGIVGVAYASKRPA